MPGFSATHCQHWASQLRAALPLPGQTLHLHEPLLGEQEAQAVANAVRSGWVSSAGPDITAFEQDLARFTGSTEAVATQSGTAALHLALLAVGVQRDDEVLCPALTFVATANAIAYCGAIPHFVDSQPGSYAVDATALRSWLETIAEQRADGCFNRRSGRKIAALIVMHAFGRPADMPALCQLAQDYELPLIEDAAEALGSSLHGQHCGLHGRVGVLSFNGNKVITTGGGGAVLAQDSALLQRIRHLGSTARLPHPFAIQHDAVGYNYRMPNLNAALGRAQLQRLPAMLAAKQALWQHYQRLFADCDWADCVAQPEQGQWNHWLLLMQLHDDWAPDRDQVLSVCQQHGLQLRPIWTLMHQLPMYHDCPRMPLPVAQQQAQHSLCLPSGPALALAVQARS